MTTVTLRAVERAQWPVIENLMQFYNYELSAWYPIPFDDDGRFRIASKAGDLGQPGTEAWLILADVHEKLGDVSSAEYVRREHARMKAELGVSA